MKPYLRAAGLGLGFIMVGAVNAAPPPQFAPRQFSTQQTHYIRATISTTMCTPVANTCAVKLHSALPYNSIVLRITAVVAEAFNSTATDVLFLGTQLGPPTNQIMAAGCNIHAVAVVTCLVDAAAANATGNGATQTGLNGGFDLWLRWTGGGGTATTGLGTVIISYIPPNDGDCTAVAMGATAPGC